MKIPGILEGTYLILALLCYVSFWYSSLKVFKKSRQKNILGYFLRFLTLGVWYGTFLEALFFGGFNTTAMVALGCVTAGLSLCLFWVSTQHIKGKEFTYIFSADVPQLHLYSGPYRYIRHPFYTAYLLCYLSSILAVSSRIVPVLVLMTIGYYFWAARNEEKKFLSSEFAESYANYIKTSGMFFPRFSK